MVAASSMIAPSVGLYVYTAVDAVIVVLAASYVVRRVRRRRGTP